MLRILGVVTAFVVSSPKAPTVLHEKDPIEKLFKFFFGEIEESPMGLSRMTVENAPDQYPAEKKRRAEPVASDDAECAAWVRPCLAQTALEQRPLKKAYDAKRDGWTPEAFHEGVDRKGPGIMLGVSGDQRFGGYNPKGWVGLGEYRPGLSAFLFVWRGDEMVKLRKVGGAGVCVYDKPESGPMFGAEGLVVPMRKAPEFNPQMCRCKLGPYYERLPNGVKTIFDGGDMAVALDNLVVYTGVYEAGEKIPFDDAIPFSLT